MFQTDLDALGGMIFDFARESRVSMWMRNTILSLDMIFISDNWAIRHIARDTVPFSETIISPDVKARYVLEINAGAAVRHGLAVGDTIAFDAGGCRS